LWNTHNGFENLYHASNQSSAQSAPKDSKKPVKQSNDLVNVAQASVASNLFSKGLSQVSVAATTSNTLNKQRRQRPVKVNLQHQVLLQLNSLLFMLHQNWL
jgi:hypothetical protein